MVPVLSLIGMVFALAVSIALPLGLFVYFRRAKGADPAAFIAGCTVMILFAFVLEALVHRIVLASPAGTAILENVWLYGLYGGAMAALFEESGRYIAFRTVLRGRRDKDVNALMYGAGHGGIEAFVILGNASINNLIYSVLINTGNTAVLTGPLSGELLEQAETGIQAMISTPSWLFLLGGVERIFAVILQISLSVPVWFAAKQKGLRYLLPAAMLIHLTVDAVTAVLNGLNVPAPLIELLVAVFAAAAACIARKIWKEQAAQTPASPEC